MSCMSGVPYTGSAWQQGRAVLSFAVPAGGVGLVGISACPRCSRHVPEPTAGRLLLGELPHSPEGGWDCRMVRRYGGDVAVAVSDQQL